jgi:hypothetical protein
VIAWHNLVVEIKVVIDMWGGEAMGQKHGFTVEKNKEFIYRHPLDVERKDILFRLAHLALVQFDGNR